MNAAADIPSPTESQPAKRSIRFRTVVLTFVPLTLIVLLLLVALNFPLHTTRYRDRETRNSMRTIDIAIQAYRSETQSLPLSLQSLIPEYLPADSRLKDAWKQDFEYSPTGDGTRPYNLRSIGEDGVSGTADDFDVWTMTKN